MSTFGVDVPPTTREPSRAYTVLASAVWLAVALPFGYLGITCWNWPTSVFADWRGWIFALTSLGCVLMATVVPPRYRVAIVGSRAAVDRND